MPGFPEFSIDDGVSNLRIIKEGTNFNRLVTQYRIKNREREFKTGVHLLDVGRNWALAILIKTGLLCKGVLQIQKKM